MKYLDDILVLVGCVLIVIATYLISLIAALYAAGVIFIVFGFFVGYGNRRGGIK